MGKIKSIENLNNLALSGKKRIAIAGVEKGELALVKQCIQNGFADFILVDDKGKVERLLDEMEIEQRGIEIYHEPFLPSAAEKAVELACEQEADLPMKGQIQTRDFLKAVLRRKKGNEIERRISQIMVFDGYHDELQFLTDCAIHITPTLMEKKNMIQNAVELAILLGYHDPKVALLGAVEMIREDMLNSMEAAILTQMNRRGQIKNCIVDGPLALDNAISKSAARKKEIASEVAGNADILVAPNIEVANTFGKALIYYGGVQSASVIWGSPIPVVMTSRTDTIENKMNTICFAAYIKERLKAQ